MLTTADDNRDVHTVLQGPDLTAFSGLWLRLMNIYRKHTVLVTQLQGESVKQITLIFSRFLDSPVCQKKKTLRPLMWAIIVYMEWETFLICGRASLVAYTVQTHTHTHTPCGNNKCVYDGDLCFLYYFRILSVFETIINSISFSLSLLNILIILTLPNKAAVLLLLNIYSVIFKLTSCSYTNMQNLES